mgnify:CR=1 FL=1
MRRRSFLLYYPAKRYEPDVFMRGYQQVGARIAEPSGPNMISVEFDPNPITLEEFIDSGILVTIRNISDETYEGWCWCQLPGTF